MANFTSGEILRQAALVLQDQGAVRWPYMELLDYLNAAIRGVVSLKPNALTKNMVLTLKIGCEQVLSSDNSLTMLSRVIRNVNSVDGSGNPVGGAVLRMLKNREIMDAMIPGWMDASVLPFSNTVSYVIYDIATPTVFFVAPGVLTNGTAKIEVTVGVQPAVIPAPASPLDLASYIAEVPLDSKYFNVILDFMLYRALTKDGSLPGAAQRAAAHKQLFDDAMQGLIGGEMSMNVGTYIAGGR